MTDIARRLVDDLLEISVIGSFSRIGPLARARLDGWREPPPGALRDRTALVTGPTSGIGRVVAERLAELGARVVLLSRDEQKLARLSDDLAERHAEQRFPYHVVDMSVLAQVRAAAAAVRASEPRLDILVDNAGVIFDERQETAEGIERSLAVLVVGPFLLTSLLTPLLQRSADGRVIAVTSGGSYTQPVRLDDLEFEARPYSGPVAYAHAKRIQLLLVRERARRLRGTTMSINAMHPGWVDTPGLQGSLPGFRAALRPILRSAEEGADTIVWLATSPDIARPGGKLYLDRRPRPFDRIPQTRMSAADRDVLWREVSALAGA